MIFKALKTNFYNGSGTLKNKLKIEENSNYQEPKKGFIKNIEGKIYISLPISHQILKKLTWYLYQLIHQLKSKELEQGKHQISNM